MSWFQSAFATVTWTPLIDATDFNGVRTDLLTTVSGIVALLFIVLGLGILYRVLR